MSPISTIDGLETSGVHGEGGWTELESLGECIQGPPKTAEEGMLRRVGTMRR